MLKVIQSTGDCRPYPGGWGRFRSMPGMGLLQAQEGLQGVSTVLMGGSIYEYNSEVAVCHPYPFGGERQCKT